MRLIDADALCIKLCEQIAYFEKIKALKDNGQFFVDIIQRQIEDRKKIIDMVDNEPTVDTERHGHWMPHITGETAWRVCSACGTGERVTFYDYFCNETTIERFYCPNCGAKMDEVEK